MSADGAFGLTVIAFIGSVFSPYYALARRRGRGVAENYCAFNVALYGRRGARWAMTERGAAQVERSAAQLAIGTSRMAWRDGKLVIDIDERCAPVPRRLHGTIRLTPEFTLPAGYLLDAAGRHRWAPIAPCARVDVVMSQPELRWSGPAYFDSNEGDEPLEAAFSHWTWSRGSKPQSTQVLYDVTGRSGDKRTLALQFDPGRGAQPCEPPALARLPRSGWRIERPTRADAGYQPRVIQTLEDAPFYSRTLIDTQVFGVQGPAIHESLDLRRFDSAWVQCLLPFRMPRISF